MLFNFFKFYNLKFLDYEMYLYYLSTNKKSDLLHHLNILDFLISFFVLHFVISGIIVKELQL